MIEVGEYVRTEDGIIAKILRFENEDYGDRGNIVYGLDREAFDKTEGFEETSEWILPDQIKKHSKNIIDLIEVGDYVNGELIEETEYDLYINSDFKQEYAKSIKTILTKEQYEANCYKVKEE